MNQKIALSVSFVILLTIIVVWVYKSAKTTPSAPTVPSAIPSVNAVPSSDASSTTSKYTTFPSKRGLKINFKTPASSGDPTYSDIASYNIYLRLADDKYEYIIDKDSVTSPKPAFTVFIAGVDKPGYYEWSDTNNGKTAGSKDAEIFIDGSIIAGLKDGSQYKVGIQATNKNGGTNPTITFSDPLPAYNSCTSGDSTGCGWDSTSVNTEKGANAEILAPVFISSTQSTSGTFPGSTDEGTPCKPEKAVDGTLYKYDKNKNCVIAGCTIPGDFISGDACVHKNTAGDTCGEGKKLYAVLDPNGKQMNDANGNPEFVCDLVDGPQDPRVKGCTEIKGTALPSNSKWSAQPGCDISCIDDTYKTNPDTKQGGCIKITCPADKPDGTIKYGPPPGCDVICKNQNWGATCQGTFPPTNTAEITPVISWSYDLTNSMSTMQPTVYVNPYIFGKNYSIVGLYKINGLTSTTKHWELPTTQGSVFSCSQAGVVKVGVKTFTPSNLDDIFSKYGFTTSLKSWTIDATNGNLVINYYITTPGGRYNTSMPISISNIVNGDAAQNIPTA